MKQIYYIVYWADFGNTYRLYHVTKSTEAAFLQRCPEAKRISRAEAIKLCRRERRARKENEAFAYYADTYIWPGTMVGNDPVEQENYGWRHIDSSGFIIW